MKEPNKENGASSAAAAAAVRRRKKKTRNEADARQGKARSGGIYLLVTATVVAVPSENQTIPSPLLCSLPTTVQTKREKRCLFSRACSSGAGCGCCFALLFTGGRQTADSKALCCALLLIFSFNNSFRVSTKAFLFHFSHLHSPICLLRKEGRGDEAEAEAAHTHANLTRRFDRHDVDEYRFL